MKKLIILIGILASNGVFADLIAKMPMKDYVSTKFDYMYEIKTDNYDKIILDCQGFVKGLYFYWGGSLERQIVMEEELCDYTNEFLTKSKAEKNPVCLELNADENSIVFSREVEKCK